MRAFQSWGACVPVAPVIDRRRVSLKQGVLLAATAIAACSTRTAQDTGTPPPPTYETLPAGDGALPRSPFDNAAPNMDAAARLAGCYDLKLGPWSNPQAHAGRVPTPARVDLTTEPHTRIYIGFRLVARTPGFADQLERYPAAWSPVGGDSLQARVWANGTSSVTLFMRRQADNQLRGVARYFTDGIVVDSTGRWMWERYPVAPASLHATDCS